ncbi:hypothetical protein [Actinocorallia longicatena]|uniref:Secreted protein n=1 Tax=Actinocorallia longicatena TaxID=111803 RepID=A0ABP6QM24_9ACTN
MAKLTSTDEKPFTLEKGSTAPADHASRLVEHLPVVSVKSVLAGANRKGKFKGASDFWDGTPPARTEWFTFDADDTADPLWQPQGLTCGSDGGGDAPDAFLVSWYKKTSKTDDAAQAVRLSFFDPDRTSPRYRHVLLVVPTAGGDYDPLRIHAGGIAWYGNLLYVADTMRGFRIFDMSRILDVPNIAGDTLVGRSGNGFHALGYSHVMPQVGSWRLTTKNAARFSFVSIDRSHAPDLLVSGEYSKDGFGRVARWALRPDGSLVTDEAGKAVPVDSFKVPVHRVQGAVTFDGRWYLSQSRGTSANATLLTGKPEALTGRAFPVGPEDLTVWRERKMLWSVTEFDRRRRAVFGVPL